MSALAASYLCVRLLPSILPPVYIPVSLTYHISRGHTEGRSSTTDNNSPRIQQHRKFLINSTSNIF